MTGPDSRKRRRWHASCIYIIVICLLIISPAAVLADSRNMQNHKVREDYGTDLEWIPKEFGSREDDETGREWASDASGFWEEYGSDRDSFSHKFDFGEDDEDDWESDPDETGTWEDGYDDYLTWENGLGSATEPDGRIVVVSIFLSDNDYSWDFSREEDVMLRDHSLTYLGIAADWITDNAARWDKYPEFIYDWEHLDNLYYEMEIEESVSSSYDDPTDDMNELIRDYVDPDSLLQEYDADSILFLAYLNSPLSNTYASYTIPYDDSLEDDTMELCYLFLRSDGEEETPAAYAHEILHTFGAPDLYTSDYPFANFGIDDSFITYCETSHPNEIMLTTYDVDTDEPYYDHISNELSEITAYYIGWTDTCREAEEFGLQESQHT